MHVEPCGRRLDRPDRPAVGDDQDGVLGVGIRDPPRARRAHERTSRRRSRRPPSPRRRRASARARPGSARPPRRGSARPRPRRRPHGSRRPKRAPGRCARPTTAAVSSARRNGLVVDGCEERQPGNVVRERLGLSAPERRQRAVAVPLEAVRGVPVALAVPGEVDDRHSGRRRMTASSPALNARRRSSSTGSTMCPSRPM